MSSRRNERRTKNGPNQTKTSESANPAASAACNREAGSPSLRSCVQRGSFREFRQAAPAGAADRRSNRQIVGADEAKASGIRAESFGAGKAFRECRTAEGR